MAIHLNNTYPAKSNAPDANYPQGSARNVATTGDGTGTPWDYLIVNDLLGWQQELIDKSGISIAGAGTPDRVGASDYYNAMRLTAGYPGLITPMAINVDPSTLGLRILLLNGAGILIANYGDLTDATYVGDGNNGSASAFYKADDAAGTIRNTSGTYLILPDFRGQFVRGLDTSGTVDPDGASRDLGNVQGWAVKKHYHVFSNVSSTLLGLTSNEYNIAAGAGVDVVELDASPGDIYTGYNIDPVDTSGFVQTSNDETRPTNVAVNWGVWY